MGSTFVAYVWGWDKVYTTGATEAFCEAGATCFIVDHRHSLHSYSGEVAASPGA